MCCTHFKFMFLVGVRVAHLFSFFLCCLSSEFRYDCRIKSMFGPSLPPVVSSMAHVIFMLFQYSGVHHIVCCVFVLFVFVL